MLCNIIPITLITASFKVRLYSYVLLDKVKRFIYLSPNVTTQTCY